MSHRRDRRCCEDVSAAWVELAVPQTATTRAHQPVAFKTVPRGGVAVPKRPRPDLEQVFRAEYVRVVAVARRVLGDDHAAEDVAQEVFLAFARSDVEVSAARGWLTAAAAHTALNVVRTNRRRAGREARAQTDPALSRPAAGGDPADAMVRRWDRAQVRAALGALPQAQAVALVLRHSGAGYAEIADALGISVTGVGTTLRRAEMALRKELSRG
jgi:RNA polymerase sigma factor (sigma-70 family)